MTTDLKTKVKELYIKAEKGKSAIPCESAVLLENQGVSGDIFCSGNSVRQVSIMFEDTIKKLEALTEKGVCVRKFSCNIVLGGTFSAEIKPGGSFVIGKAVLNVTKLGKECFHFCGNYTCPLVSEAIFASVAVGAKIKKGDDAFYA